MASNPSPSQSKTTVDDNITDHSKHRSHKRTLEVDELSDTANVENTRKRRLSTASRDTMMRSLSPAGANLTRTGRVSKAAKGQPVHHCDCGKTYTRAEHLRRHQQNHKPGAFPCDIQGCERAFYREDLLARHKAKHNDPLESSDFMPAQVLGSEPDLLAPVQSTAPYYTSGLDLQANVLAPDLSICDVSSQTSRRRSAGGSRKGYLPLAGLQPPPLGVTVDHTQADFGQQSVWGLDPLPRCSFDTGYNTPEPTYGLYPQPHLPLTLYTEQSWTSDASSLQVSHSPISGNCTTPIPFWRGPSPVFAQLHTPGSDSSNFESRNHVASSGHQSFVDLSGTETHTAASEYRDMLEQDELLTPTSAPQAANFGPNQYHHRTDNEQRYLDAFWSSIHPSWPIVHKPTFDLLQASPLLRAATLTLGATSTNHPIDAGNACILHRRCLKVIKKRTINQTHSYRLTDMQAILLVELFAITKSRRPPLRLSKPFVDTYHSATRTHDTESTNALFATLGDSFEPLHDVHIPKVTFEGESIRRLLAAYYILDQQHSAFFGREPTEVPDFMPSALSLAQPLDLWDLDPTQQIPSFYGHVVDSEHFTPQPLLPQAATKSPQAAIFPNQLRPEIFVPSLLLTYTHSKPQTQQPHSPPPKTQPLPHPTNANPHLCLLAQTHDLATHTPIHSLLAVAGESWAMGEKLASRGEYVKAQGEVRLWSTSSNYDSALTAALEIVRLHARHAKTTFLLHEWSLHLAALVVWAGAYADAGRELALAAGLEVPVSASVSVSGEGGVVRSREEIDGVIARLALGGAGAGISWPDARRMVMWAKGRLEKGGCVRFCGVVSGAVDVLGAVGCRGWEGEWF